MAYLDEEGPDDLLPDGLVGEDSAVGAVHLLLAPEQTFHVDHKNRQDTVQCRLFTILITTLFYASVIVQLQKNHLRIKKYSYDH